MAPFLRIAFNAYDVGALPALTETPICAIKMKESVNTGMYRCKHTHAVIILSRKGSRGNICPKCKSLNSLHLLGSNMYINKL